MKATVLLLLGTATSTSPSTLVSAVVVTAAVLLALNSLGVLPRGKTADRLKLDLDVTEKSLAKETARVQVLEAKLERLPNLESHERVLNAMLTSLQEHDLRMSELGSKLVARLDAISVAVIPAEPRD